MRVVTASTSGVRFFFIYFHTLYNMYLLKPDEEHFAGTFETPRRRFNFRTYNFSV